VIVKGRDEGRGDQEVVFRPVHLDRRALKKVLGDDKRIVRSAPYGRGLDQVFGTHPVAAVADEVATNAPRGGEVTFPAIETFHLLRFRKVFEV
jgi:hypothetical protein